MDLKDRIIAARKAGVPLIAISSPDVQALERMIVGALGVDHNGVGHHAVAWDIVQGYRPANELGKEAIAALQLSDKDLAASKNPIVAMQLASKFPGASKKGTQRTFVIAHNLTRALAELAPMQAVSNLRDEFKANGRTLLVIATNVDLPAELRGDFVVLDEPLPTDKEYAEILRTVPGTMDLAESQVSPTVDAVRGLSAFCAEQVLAMSSPKGVLNISEAWERKRATVNQTKGLKMTLDGPALSDLKGLDTIVEDLSALCEGPDAPHAFLFIDEIEKALAGLGKAGGHGDSSGVSQDFLQTMLVEMEDNTWDGFIFYGVRGAAKTALARSIGAKYGLPLITMDPGGMKGGIVGSSEKAHRDAMRVVRSVGGKRVVVLATANNLDVIPPELLRRFTYGTWYFDLPTDEAKADIWPVYMKAYGIPPKTTRPSDQGWTGAEIRNCCKIQRGLGGKLSLAEVGATRIVPVSRQDQASLEAMRERANGRFLSVSYPGPFQKDRVEKLTGRFVEK